MGNVRLCDLGAWTGGTVVDLAVSGNTVLAATFGGIYTSVDGGQQWRLTGKNLPDWFVQAVALAPVGAQLFGLAASHLGWLYRSTDGGESWEIISYWSDLGIVTRLVTSPSFASDGIVFACTEENGIFKSTNRGQDWKQANFGLLNLNASALCFSPNFAEDEVLFAGTDGGGLFRSRNAGRAWRESGEGLPDSAVQSLAISPRFVQDGVVFAGTEEQGLYRSDDGGRTWSAVGEVPAEACINALYLAPDWDAGGRMVAATDLGLTYSVDGGQRWQGVKGGPDYPYAIARCGDRLLSGAYEDGVYASPDAARWQTSNEGLAAHLPPIVCFSEAFAEDRTVLMASMEGTLVRSEDAGQSWAVLSGEDGFSVSSMDSACAGRSMELLAAAEGNLLFSGDGGETWQTVRDTGADPLSAVAFATGDAQDRARLAGTAGGQVFLCRRSGAPWQRIAQLGERAVTLAACPASGGLIPYAVTGTQATDGTWTLSVRAGPDWAVMASRTVSEPVAVLHPLADGTVTCSLGRSVLRIDGDKVVAEGDLEGDAAVSCLASTGDMILAGSRFGLFRSLDGAQSWEWLTVDISAVALHVSPEGRIYAVEMGGRLWEVDVGT